MYGLLSYIPLYMYLAQHDLLRNNASNNIIGYICLMQRPLIALFTKYTYEIPPTTMTLFNQTKLRAPRLKIWASIRENVL